MSEWAAILGPGVDLGQLGALLWIAARFGRFEGTILGLARRMAAIEVWAARKGHIIEERDGR